METYLPFLIPLIFLIVFPLFWSAICILISYTGGWQKLASQFASDKERSGDDFRWHSGRFRTMTNYSSVLNITVNWEGIALKTSLPFRPGHKPLFIPWEAIHDLNDTNFGFTRSTKFRIQSPGSDKSTKIALYGKNLAAAIQKNTPPTKTDNFV